MIGFGSLAEKADAAVTKAEEALNALYAAKDAHGHNKPEPSDLDALIDWKRAGADFELRIEAAEEALAFHRDAAATQAQAAAEAEVDRQHAAAKKLAKQGERLTLEAVAVAEKLADVLAALEANRAEIEAANAVRGHRPFIADGEQRLREVPAHTIPAVTRRVKGWFDKDDEPCAQLIEHKGQMVPTGMSGDYEYREIEVVQSCERFEGAHMPTRLAGEIRLVDLKGRRIWPRT